VRTLLKLRPPRLDRLGGRDKNDEAAELLLDRSADARSPDNDNERLRGNAMGEISRVALFGKLNSLAYKAIEGATVFCKLRGNPYVELEHWLQQILQTQDSDVQRIVKYFELDPSRLAKDATISTALRRARRFRLSSASPMRPSAVGFTARSSTASRNCAPDT
jgi:hypothetical protein